jgi:hypothetical protein
MPEILGIQQNTWFLSAPLIKGQTNTTQIEIVSRGVADDNLVEVRIGNGLSLRYRDTELTQVWLVFL